MTTTNGSRLVLRTAPSLRLLVAGASALFLGPFLLSNRFYGASTQTLAFGILFGLGVIGLLEAVTARVSLEPDGIAITTNFKTRRIPREAIDTVTWEKGAGVALRLKDGSWEKLPPTGHSSQGTTNSIRAWLQQTGIHTGAPSRPHRRRDP